MGAVAKARDRRHTRAVGFNGLSLGGSRSKQKSGPFLILRGLRSRSSCACSLGSDGDEDGDEKAVVGLLPDQQLSIGGLEQERLTPRRAARGKGQMAHSGFRHA